MKRKGSGAHSTVAPEPEREKDSSAQEEVNSMVEAIKGDDHMFLRYIYKHIRSNQVLHSTVVATPEQWAKATGGDAWLGNREKSTRALDDALSLYYNTVHVCINMLRHSRVVCESTGFGAAQNNIGFSFPGFDSQVVDVGEYAVISAWHMFDHSGPLAFTTATWEGAIGSKSSAKELMQSSPDVTALYEEGNVKEAKRIMHMATLEILHNIFLASYARARKDKLRRGDSVGWAEVMQTQDDLEKHEQNWKHLTEWISVKYWYNAPSVHLNTAINNTIKTFSSLSRRESRSLEVALATCHSHRLFFGPLQWIAFVQMVVVLRKRGVQKIQSAVARWLEEHSSKRSRNVEDVKKLKNMTAIEMNLLEDLEAHLPTYDALEQTIRAVEADQDEKMARAAAFLESKANQAAASAAMANSSLGPRPGVTGNAASSSGSSPGSAVRGTLSGDPRVSQARRTHVSVARPSLYDPEAPSKSVEAVLASVANALEDDQPAVEGENPSGVPSLLPQEEDPVKTRNSGNTVNNALSDNKSFAVQFTMKEIAFEGFLSKRSPQLLVWKRRWWVLQEGMLYAFLTERVYDTPLEVVDLRLYSVVTPSTLGATMFTLRSQEDTIVFTANNEAECSSWIATIDAEITSCSIASCGVNWNMVKELAQVFGVTLGPQEAQALAPALGGTLGKLGITTPFTSRRHR